MVRKLALILALSASTFLPMNPCHAAGGEESLPRLVLVVVVDQLRRDRLTSNLTGGLGLILRRGRNYPEAVLDHGVTETCPGHLSILSGRHPGQGGIVANSWIDKATGATVYCIEDAASPSLGGGAGRSPANIREDGLGDWMQASWPLSRVYSVAGKDRAAVTLGGRNPDAAYWLDSGGVGGMNSSHYYLQELPVWVDRFNEELRRGFDGGIPERWIHTNPGPRPDDYPYEDDSLQRSSGHPLFADDLQQSLAQISGSPYLDDLVLRFARSLVIEEGLGADQIPDLLAIGLSATDRVGHLYGPESAEAKAALMHLDRIMGDFLDFLDHRLGRENILVVLSSDHGVLPIPEWLKANKRSQCPLDTGRQSILGVAVRLLWHVHWKWGPYLAMPGQLVKFSGYQIAVNREYAAAHLIDPDAVIVDLESWLESEDYIEEAWTSREILQGTGSFAELYRHSHDPERSGDLVLQVKKDCLVRGATGTGHGSPYEYDRAIPLVIMGSGFPQGKVTGTARTVDIAPTLAKRLGIRVPPDLDGAPLR